MIYPNKYQLSQLGAAINHLKEMDISPYLQLKSMLTEKPTGFQAKFRKLFSSYYRLNSAGLSNDFKDRYFELLFSQEFQLDGDPYTPILKELYGIPRRKGDNALQCSFVSKMVAVHDETRPIFDRHVSNFFGVMVPSNGSTNFRIAGFVANLKLIREIYNHWSESSQFQELLLKVKQKLPSLKECADPRIADFLVWTVGDKELRDNATTELSE